MDEPTDRKATPVDIFTTPTAPRTDPKGSAPEKQGIARPKGRVPDIKPAYFVIAAVVIGAVWIAWPSARRSQPVPSRMLNSADAMSASAASLPASAASSAEAVVAPDAMTASLASQVATASAPVAQDSVLAGSNVAPTSASTDPRAMAAATPPLPAPAPATLATPPLASPSGACRIPATATAGRARKFRHGTRLAIASATEPAAVTIEAGKSAQPGDFVLNTVYRNQAWLQRGESTWVVQAGDVIDGLRILQVDAALRLVTTSRGVIH